MRSNESSVKDEEGGGDGSGELEEEVGEVEGRLVLLEGPRAESRGGCAEGRFGGESGGKDVVLDAEHGDLAAKGLENGEVSRGRSRVEVEAGALSRFRAARAKVRVGRKAQSEIDLTLNMF